MRQALITVAACAAALLILYIPVTCNRIMDGLRASLRTGRTRELGMTFGDYERMSEDELTDHLLELASGCPIDLPRYCCPIMEFRRLEPAEVHGWLRMLHRRDKLALAARHYGCAKWNQRC